MRKEEEEEETLAGAPTVRGGQSHWLMTRPEGEAPR